jgi:hypothetical protein
MPLTFDPASWYSEYELILRANFTSAQLARGRKRDGLKYRELGRGKRIYQGQWLIDWLAGDTGKDRQEDSQ